MYKSFRPRPSKLRRRFYNSIQHVRPLSTEWLKSCDTGRCYTRSPPWKLVNTIARPRRHTAAVETRLLIAKYTSPRRPATVSFDVLMWTGRSKRTISSPPSLTSAVVERAAAARGRSTMIFYRSKFATRGRLTMFQEMHGDWNSLFKSARASQKYNDLFNYRYVK